MCKYQLIYCFGKYKVLDGFLTIEKCNILKKNIFFRFHHFMFHFFVIYFPITHPILSLTYWFVPCIL